MRRIRYLLPIFFFISVIFILGTKVNAVNTGFETNPMPDDRKEKYISNIQLQFLRNEPKKKPISCFDVSQSRLIAIGQDASQRKIVCVYSEEGAFQYGYTFNCYGNIGLEWDGENLNIYFVRSDALISVSPTGQILDALEVQNSSENNNYNNHFFHSAKKTIGNTVYSMEKDDGIFGFFAVNYSQIIAIDETGVQKMIYQASSNRGIDILAIICWICVFAYVLIAFIVRHIIRKRGSH